MAELPNHIADMCGVVTAKTQSQAPAEEYKAVKTEWDDTDQVMTISYRDQVMGWINERNVENGPKYRALSVNHQVKHCYTQSQAMNWLIEDAI
jgi:hypothetical protein